AARAGDFEALVQVLDPDVVFRADLGPGSPGHPPLAGSGAVAGHVLRTAPRFVSLARPVRVNGEAGALFGTHDDPVAVIGFTIVGGRIAELNLVADPAKLRHLTIEPQEVPMPAQPLQRAPVPNSLRLGPRSRRLIRSVARVINPLVLRFAGRRHVPVLGVLHHRGRRTGREYATPLGIRPTAAGGFVLPLTLGEAGRGVRHIPAAGPG